MKLCKKLCTIENFIILYLLHVIAIDISFIPVKVSNVLNVIFYSASFLLSAVILYNKFKKDKSVDKELTIIFVFLIGYIFTILLDRNNLFGNIKSFATALLQLIIVFYYLFTLKEKDLKNFLHKICKVFIALLFILSLLSLSLFCMNIILTYGYMRYNGVFNNANSAVLCSTAAILSLLYLLNSSTKKEKVFHVINIVVQSFIVTLSASRGAELMLISSFSMILICFSFITFKKSFKRILLCMLLVGGSYLAYSLIIANVAPHLLGIVSIQHQGDGNSGDDNDEQDTEERTDFNKSDSIRMNLVVAGFNSFTKHPIVGVSSRNLATTVSNENKDLVLTGIKGAGLHNTYMQVLVSNGLIGFISTCAITILCMWKGFAKFKKDNKYSYVYALLFGIMTYMVLSSVLYYTHTVEGIIFWIILAIFCNDNQFRKKESVK